MMPEMDGLTLAKAVRDINPAIPIIFLTARNQKEDVLEGFRTGGDDYITKPFSMEELLYRIEVIFRRTAGSATPAEEGLFQIGAYLFDSKRQLLLYNDERINLTTKESELLSLLYNHKNEILERNFALKNIWIDDNYFNARSMDVYITRLRKYSKGSFCKDPEYPWQGLQADLLAGLLSRRTLNRVSALRKACWGTSTLPTWRIRFLLLLLFLSRSFRFLVISPP
jgi:DNA-binding response OmpR family regulator